MYPAQEFLIYIPDGQNWVPWLLIILLLGFIGIIKKLNPV